MDDATPHPSSIERRDMLKILGAAPVAMVSGCLGDDDDEDDDIAAGDQVVLEVHSPEFRNYVDEQRWIANGWEDELGIEIDLITRDWPTFLGEVFGQAEYEGLAGTVLGSSPPRMDPFFFLSTGTSDGIPVPNQSHYSNDDYDALFEEFLATPDPDERAQVVAEIEELYFEDVVCVGYGFPPFASPTNTAEWDVTPTDHLGYSAFNQRGIYEASPRGDLDTLVFGTVGDLDTSNPASQGDEGLVGILRLVYEPVRAANFDGSFSDWAGEVDVDDEAETYTVTLNEGMEFHDGEPVTAEDLAFSMEFYRDYSFESFDAWAGDIDEVEVLGDLEVEISLTRSNASFMDTSLAYLMILPEHIWAPVPEEVEAPAEYDMPVEEMVGNGPFMIEEYERDRWRLVANEDYYRDPPDYDEMIIVSRGSFEGIRSDMAAGEIHANYSTVPMAVAREIEESADDVELITTNSIHYERFALRHDIEPTDDPAFRRALTRCIDHQTFSETFYEGEHVPAHIGPIHPDHPIGSSEYHDLPSVADMYDPDEARSILEDAGYTWDDDGNLRYPE